MPARFFEPLETRRLMSASLVNGVLTVTGTELNDVIAISQDSTRVRVNEDGRVSAFTASLVTKVVVKGFGGNDKILGRPNLTKPMTGDGGAGRDSLVGGSGNDRLHGDTDDDYLDGTKGADLMSGGEGVDHADYSTRSADVRISLDDIADDGEAGERDNLRSDIESLRTGKGNDRVIGSNADNVIYTNDGSDTIYGMAGNDRISTSDWSSDAGLDRAYGGEGDDWIRSASSSLIAYGDDGNDRILGSDRGDKLDGGPGADDLAGHGGNDRLEGGDDDDVLKGWSGNDTMRGGAGNDWIAGDSGNDLIWGEVEPGLLSSIGIDPRVPSSNVTSTPTTFSGMISPINLGNIFVGGGGSGPVIFKPIDPLIVTKINYDTIFGGDGNDTIHGGTGDDRIHGDGDNDRLFGDAGADEVFGGAGQDTLVSIGGGTDKLFGERDGDTFWKNPGDSTDADFGEILFGGIQEVASFANGTSIELEGQKLRDPDAYDPGEPNMLGDEFDPQWKNFRDMPLFGSRGILSSDVRQGRVKDGSLLAVLAGLAKHQPIRIRQSIVDLGDGTFAVRLLGNDGSPKYYRVDADLPVNANQTPHYAALGHDGAMWVAIMEKAYILHRGMGGTYRSLNGLAHQEAFGAFGMKADEFLSTSNNAWLALEQMQRQLQSGKIIVVRTTSPTVAKSAPIRYGGVYVVESVNFGRAIKRVGDSEAEIVVPLTLTLRNPWDADGAGNDGSDDGLVTLNWDHLNNNPILVQTWS